jgi:hypothetical protein
MQIIKCAIQKLDHHVYGYAKSVTNQGSHGIRLTLFSYVQNVPLCCIPLLLIT